MKEIKCPAHLLETIWQERRLLHIKLNKDKQRIPCNTFCNISIVFHPIVHTYLRSCPLSSADTSSMCIWSHSWKEDWFKWRYSFKRNIQGRSLTILQNYHIKTFSYLKFINSERESNDSVREFRENSKKILKENHMTSNNKNTKSYTFRKPII